MLLTIMEIQYFMPLPSPMVLMELTCAQLSNFSEMAIVMGQVVDYFRPNGCTVCEMLTSRTPNSCHQWRPNATAMWITPEYSANNGYLGGSASGWPRLQGFDQ